MVYDEADRVRHTYGEVGALVRIERTGCSNMPLLG